MWHEGYIKVPQKDGPDALVRYQVKSYDEGSKWGINEGRISKLWLQIDDQVVAYYDRGWDMRPNCEAAEIALCILLNDYN